MIWIVIGLVAALTVGFVVYLFYVRPRRFARHGTLEVPGEGEIRLPAGEIGVFYEDNQRWRLADRPQLGDGFSLVVRDESGDVIEIGDPGTDTVWKSGGKNRIPYGLISVAAPGTFKVASRLTAQPDMARLTFGDPAND